MIVVYGTRLYGTVERCGTSRVATRFFHIYGMPLVPLGSVLVTEEGEDNAYRGIPLGLNLRSLAAGYARLWLPLAAVVMLIVAWQGSYNYSMDEAGTSGTVTMAGLGLAALAGGIWAWVRFGKLSLEERAQRMVYADFTGIPADVALLGELKSSLREKLLQQLGQRAPEVAATGYRIGVDAAAGLGSGGARAVGARPQLRGLGPHAGSHRMVPGARHAPRHERRLARPALEQAARARSERDGAGRDGLTTAPELPPESLPLVPSPDPPLRFSRPRPMLVLAGDRSRAEEAFCFMAA